MVGTVHGVFHAVAIVDQVLPDGGVIKVAICRAPDDVTIILVDLPEGRASLSG